MHYKNLNGDYGVSTYEYGSDYIRIQFSAEAIYRYSYQTAFQIHPNKAFKSTVIRR